MAEFLGNYEYLLAWVVYVIAGIGCSAVWWRITGFISHRGWRELLRGTIVVLIFTPWFVGDSPQYYAPAVVVLMMDLMLEGASAGLNGGIALLFSIFLMLCVLTGRLLRSKKSRLE